MRKVLLDQDSCVASGPCVTAALSVFDQRDEDGIAILLKDEVVGDEIDDVGQAAAICPALAIRLHG